MAKQTLYEILGVASDASAEDIQRAYELRRKALHELAEDDDRRNQLGFLDYAREVLSDTGRRAAYDWQLRPLPLAPTRVPRRRSRWRGPIAGLFALVATLFLGWLFLPPQPNPARSSSSAGPPAEPAAQPATTRDVPSLEEAAAALGDFEPPQAAPPAVPQVPPRRIVITGSPLMNRILLSTYAVVGSQGFGTGVAVEPDRLLTNCHVIAPNVLKGKIYAFSAVTGASVEITEAAFLVREDACVVHAPGLGAQPIALGDTSRLQRGARMHNVGFGDGNLVLAQGQYLGSLQRFGQYYMLSTNACIPGVSGGPLVDDEGRLIGLTSGGVRDSRGNNICASLTVETARLVLSERMMQIDAFPPNYLTNLRGRR